MSSELIVSSEPTVLWVYWIGSLKQLMIVVSSELTVMSSELAVLWVVSWLLWVVSWLWVESWLLWVVSQQCYESSEQLIITSSTRTILDTLINHYIGIAVAHRQGLISDWSDCTSGRYLHHVLTPHTYTTGLRLSSLPLWWAGSPLKRWSEAVTELWTAFRQRWNVTVRFTIHLFTVWPRISVNGCVLTSSTSPRYCESACHNSFWPHLRVCREAGQHPSWNGVDFYSFFLCVAGDQK